MKNSLLLLIAVSTICFYSCNKNDENHNTYSALINGGRFEGELAAYKMNDETTYFEVIRNDRSNEREMDLNFSYIPFIIGDNRVYRDLYDPIGNLYKRPNARLNTVRGGDAGCGEWEVLNADSLTNKITVTKSSANVLEGTFSVTFLKVENCPVRVYPDTLRFTNGTFHFEF